MVFPIYAHHIHVYISVAVKVSFNATAYEYEEDDGTVTNIALVLNTTIAQDLSVSIAGG